MVDLARDIEGADRHRGDARLDRDVAAEVDVVALKSKRPEIAGDEVGSRAGAGVVLLVPCTKYIRVIVTGGAANVYVDAVREIG